jgi:hypothetical protein
MRKFPCHNCSTRLSRHDGVGHLLDPEGRARQWCIRQPISIVQNDTIVFCEVFAEAGKLFSAMRVAGCAASAGVQN